MVILKYYEHIALAGFLGYGLDYFLLQFTLLEMISYYIFIIVGSLLPDIDTDKSFLGSKIKPVSTIIYATVGHRTLTHSILIITILFFIGVLIWDINTILSGLMLGSVFHVVGDMLTPQGVAICYPINKRRYKFIK